MWRPVRPVLRLVKRWSWQERGILMLLLLLLRWYRHAPMALEVMPSFKSEG